MLRQSDGALRYCCYLLVVISALGITIQGRMGPVNLSFVGDQIKTVLAMGDANTRMVHEDDRADWYGEVWDRVRSSPTNVVVGEGIWAGAD